MNNLSYEQQIREIVKCRKNSHYFINEYIYFYDTQNNQTIDLKLWDFQEDYVASFQKDRFIIALKSRQLGFTTVTLALALHEIAFFQNTRILIIAQTESDAMNLLSNIKFMYDHLPDYLKPVTGRNSTTILEFPKLNSSIEVKACSPKAGRSIQATHVILDEYAFYNLGKSSTLDEDIYTSIYPTISKAGKLTIISTPNGMGNHFHQLITKAKNGDSIFKLFELKWQVRPDRDEAWYQETLKALGPKKFAQEYECSFLQSGSPVFNSEYLSIKAQPKEPNRNHRYVIGADTSDGDINSDYSVASIIDLDTMEQVKEVRLRATPDKFAQILDNLGRQYNNAVVGVERNNMGGTVLLRLKDLSYPNIYKYKDGKDGWLTSSTSKPIMIDDLEEALRTEQLKICSPILLTELQTFQHLGGGKMGAPSSYHDDTVMSLAIAYALRKRNVSKGYKRPANSGW